MAPPDSYSRQGSPTASRLTLHLGVLVQPYRSRGKKASALTTGDVAEILEAKYGIMAAYYRVHEKDVAKMFENSVAGALESMIMGQRIDPFAGATQGIEAGFKQFLSSKEVERIGIAGVPTHAALMGVNHRMKNPYKRRARRPSFIDTGLYSASFKSWCD
jgi:hypothetical protein